MATAAVHHVIQGHGPVAGLEQNVACSSSRDFIADDQITGGAHQNDVPVSGTGQVFLLRIGRGGRGCRSIDTIHVDGHASNRESVRFSDEKSARSGVSCQIRDGRFDVVTTDADAAAGRKNKSKSRNINFAVTINITVCNVAASDQGHIAVIATVIISGSEGFNSDVAARCVADVPVEG